MRDESGTPQKQGLYDPRFEKDSCGIGFVADIKGRRSHDIIEKALSVLESLSHRGAQGADPFTGDGAGILLQIPHDLFTAIAPSCGLKLPEPGAYAVAQLFLPQRRDTRSQIEQAFERIAREENVTLLGWRDVPVKSGTIGPQARATEPCIRQLFVGRGDLEDLDETAFERKLYLIRKRVENFVGESGLEGREAFFVTSFSSRTIVYKGMLLPEQLPRYFPDLTDPRAVTALALVHSRFSTNTFPAWGLAHPYRYICHNGEINTVKGNINWMLARQGRLHSEHFGARLNQIFPIVDDRQSDSACLDNALEFIHMGGRTLPHAMMMLIPEPWVANSDMDLDRRGFYEYHSAIMEPWDGPAAVCFTDGRVIGATLDRNGLRPCRYQITTDDLVVLASEAGVLPAPIGQIREKGRLQPGKMFLVDTEAGRLVSDEEIKSNIAKGKPYREWVIQDRISLDELPMPLNIPQPDHATLRQRQQAFGYTIEELKQVLMPMVITGEEPISSMGNDTPLAVLSDRPQLLFKYFRQHFAQVTNPPIDPIREHLVMSLVTSIGPRPNLLRESPGGSRRIKVPQPILTNSDLEKIRQIGDPSFKTKTLRMLFRAKAGPEGLRAGVVDLCRQASRAIREGYKFLILSDKGMDGDWAPIPSLLAVSAVHHHLVRKSTRAEVALIIESGEPRDVHHFACLLGYGAGTINPYLAFESLVDMTREGFLPEGIDEATAQNKYVAAINKGLLKIISKMGISTIQSYCGAQIFEAIGLERECVDRYFNGTISRVGGIGLFGIGRETLERHQSAYAPTPVRVLDPGGEIHYRIQGEHHNWNPETISKLQLATRDNDPKTFKEFARLANDESRTRSTLRGLLDFEYSPNPIDVSEVEPASEIVKRFTTGAMSLGAISREAHETLAIAMNRIGAKSNSGEGGEDPERYVDGPDGESRSSAIKQVASARFGVTAHYLVNARELQIKMAQGAKPGEGGQLPGHKVDAYIARLRHSNPGVGLISPPPHHDIYSIEDLAQLIFDLKNANPVAAVSVKLVSEAGVGTIAAGVAKAHADKILISGDSGGTGASPLSSIKYAGLPWELGIAETHQTLVLNSLRGRVRLETDGQMKTGRDVVIAALLGAEEFGFATAPLIVEGCIMMRKCHLNTCPVGIATQDPVLRKKFAGRPEHVVNYFFFVAEETRELMARLGFRRLDELVGRVDRLKVQQAVEHWKTSGLDLSPLLHQPRVPAGTASRNCERQNHGLEHVLDRRLLEKCAPALERGGRVELELPIRNTDRSTGTMLSGEVARRHGLDGLPTDTISIRFTGSAGQSFGAFLAPGIRLHLTGEANDYAGKGLSGGKIVVVPPAGALYDPGETILIGNTALFGATGGEAYFNGMAGERFAVRNSGARAVVEGTGDHGCEYMTGGRVVVLGRTGRNFAAGMSGGVAYIYNVDGAFETRCNMGLIELEKVTTTEDEHELRQLIEAHLEYTGSHKAKAILADWQRSLEKFIKIMPRDYKRVLEQQRQAARAVARKPSKSAMLPEGSPLG